MSQNNTVRRFLVTADMPAADACEFACSMKALSFKDGRCLLSITTVSLTDENAGLLARPANAATSTVSATVGLFSSRLGRW